MNEPTPTSLRDQVPQSRLPFLVFLVLLTLLHLWIVPILPTQDGAIQLLSSRLLVEYLADPLSPLHEEYTLNPDPTAHWFSTAVTLSFAWLPVYAAEKAILTLAVLLYMLAVIMLQRTFLPGTQNSWVMLLPFVFNYYFYMGMLFFVLCLPMSLIALALWRQTRAVWSRKWFLVLTLSAILVFLMHRVPFVALCLFVAGLALRDAVVRFVAFLQQESFTRACFLTIRFGIVETLWLLPAIFLFFLADLSSAPANYMGFAKQLENLSRLSSLTAFSRHERFFFYAILLPVLSIGLWRLREWRPPYSIPSEPTVLLVVCGIALFLLIPDTKFPASLLSGRFQLYFLIFLALWSLESETRPRVLQRMQALTVVLLTALLLMRTVQMTHLSSSIQELTRITGQFESGSRVLALAFRPEGRDAADKPMADFTRPFRNLGAHVVLSCDGRLVLNEWAELGIFPLIYSPDSGGFEELGIRRRPDQQGVWALHNIAEANYAQGAAIDYVVLQGIGPDGPKRSTHRLVLSSIESHFVEVDFGQDRRFVRVYRPADSVGE